MWPVKLLQRFLSSFLLTLYLLVDRPAIYIPYFFKKWKDLFLSYIITCKSKFLAFKILLTQYINDMFNFKSILFLLKIFWHLAAFLGSSVILVSFWNPFSDFYAYIKQWLDITFINISLNWFKSVLDNLSNWIDSVANKDLNKPEISFKENESNSENWEESLRKSYSFNEVKTESVDSPSSNKDNTLHNYGKYILIAAGIVVLGAVLYYYKDSILSYISSEKTSKGVNTDSSPTSTSSSNLNEENYKKFFKSPDSSPASSTTSDLIDLNSSPTSTSSSVTIKPNVSSSYASDSLPSSPESILIKPESPEPKKILLRISRERLKELEDKDLSPLPSPFDNE